MARSSRPTRRRCGQGAPKPLSPAVARRLRGYLRSWPEAASRRWIGTSQTAKLITTTSSQRGDGGQRAPPRWRGWQSRMSRSVGGKQRRLEAVYTVIRVTLRRGTPSGGLSAYLRRWRR